MKLGLVLLALTLGLESSTAHRYSSTSRSKQRCLNNQVVNLKRQQTNLQKQQSSVQERLLKVEEKSEVSSSCAQDFRKWYCDKDVRQWATGVTNYSTQANPYEFAANKIMGLPDVYPNVVSSAGQWFPSTPQSDPWDVLDWIELEYEESLFASRVDVYQVVNAGGVSKILYRNDSNETWTELYTETEIVAVNEAKILSAVPEGGPVLMKYVRLEINQSASQHRGIAIDAVSMTGKRDCPAVCADL